MKKKFDIRLNPQKPSREDVERHKNFESLMQNFKHVPTKPALPSLGKVLIGTAATAAIVAGVLLYQAWQKTNSYEAREDAYFASLDFVNPPLEDIAPEYANFRVVASKGGVFEYPSGSRLTVPPAAFVYENGQPVSGDFDLQYREMNDVIDIFLAGIPMEYDSAGGEYYLESGGMIEIKAEQKGRQLELAPGKHINVEMLSVVNSSAPDVIPSGYNIYYLDQQARRWVYKAPNIMKAAPSPASESTRTELQREVSPPAATETAMAARIRLDEDALNERRARESERRSTLRPRAANWDDYVFELELKELFRDWDKGRKARDPYYQELKQLYTAYQNMVWRVSPNSEVAPQRLEKEFQRVKSLHLAKINGREYELTLENDSTTITVIVEPVLMQEAEEQAVADYAQGVAEMQKEKTSKAKASKAVAEKTAESEKLKELRNKTANVQKLESRKYSWGFKEPVQVVNRFAVTKMGVWNVDKPFIIIEPEELLAEKFTDKKGKQYPRTTLYIVDTQQNTVRRLMAHAGATIQINANSRNAMWLVTEDNKIAVFRPEQFDQLDIDASSYTFVMDCLPTIISSEEELRRLLLM